MANLLSSRGDVRVCSKHPLVVGAFALHFVGHSPHIVGEGKLGESRLPVLFWGAFDWLHEKETQVTQNRLSGSYKANA